MLIVYTYTQGQNQAHDHVLIIKPTFFSNGGALFSKEGRGKRLEILGTN